MNLSIATFFFVAASASAHNLRAHAPVRYLQGPPSSSSSSSSAVDTYRVACVITCEDLSVEDLEDAAQDALDEINSSSSSSSTDSKDDGQRRLKREEKEFIEINNCNKKQMEKAVESIESSSSKSRRGRVRRLSKDDSDLRMTCIDATSAEVKQRAAGCGKSMKEFAKTLRDKDRRLGDAEVTVYSSDEALTRAMGNGCGNSGSRD